MKHHRSSLLLFLSIVVAAMLLGAGEAQARRGFMLFTSGTGFSELGKIKPEKMAEARIPGAPTLDKVGWKYDYFGIFWLDIWNWGGEYCIYTGDNYAAVSKADAAEFMGVPESQLGKPLNYRMPYGLLVVVGLLSLKFVPRLLMKRKQQQAASNFDPSQGSTPQQPWTPPAPPSGGPPPIPPPMPPEQ